MKNPGLAIILPFAVLFTWSLAQAQSRGGGIIVAALAYDASCVSKVELKNLGDQLAVIEVEGYRAAGSLVGLTGLSGNIVRLQPGQSGIYQLQITEETDRAWVRVREQGPVVNERSKIAVSGYTACSEGGKTHSSPRQATYATRNPWYNGEVTSSQDERILLVNTSNEAARATACYSSGALYSIPSEQATGSELLLLCSQTVDLQIPPLATHWFPLSANGNSHFTLKTAGDSIVLQMLRPLPLPVTLFEVNSTIKFEGEPSVP